MSNNPTNKNSFDSLSGELSFEDLEVLADQQAEMVVGGAPKEFRDDDGNPGADKKVNGRMVSQIAKSGDGKDNILEYIFNS